MMICGKVSECFCGVCRRAHGLPEGEEDDEFDSEDFYEWSVLGDIESNLNVELDEAVHGNGNT